MDRVVEIAQATQVALGINIDAMDFKPYVSGVQSMIKPAPSSDDNFRFDKGRTQVIGIQLVCRGNNWLEVWNFINLIHELWQVNDTLIQGKIQANNNPSLIGIDEHGLHEFTALYTAEIERS